MARRSKGSAIGILFLVMVGGIIAAIQKIVDAIGAVTLGVLILSLIAGAILFAQLQ